MNMMHTSKRLLGAVVLFVGGLAGLSGSPAQAFEGPVAGATLFNGAGATVGQVTFQQVDTKVQVRIEATGINPGFHGFHLHDVGTCTTPDFSSAGGHYNPGGRPHDEHPGDMPVLFARTDQGVEASFTTDNYTVNEIRDADVAAVIHANADNYANIPVRYGGPDATTFISGDSGARIACGRVTNDFPDLGAGYWLVNKAGGVFTFGEAPFLGTTGGLNLNQPIVGAARTPSGQGLYLTASDGGIFTYGDATFQGSTGDLKLNQPVVGMATPPGDATAVLSNAAGQRIGVVTFAQEPGRVRVTVEASGIAPNSFHGFHLLNNGTCTAPDFTSAGGHYNPGFTVHDDHAGDMPVLFAKKGFGVEASFTTDNYTVPEILAADVAAVITSDPDNYANIPAARYGLDPNPTNPTLNTGDSGASLACGPVRPPGGSTTPSYWTVAADGGIFAFGDAAFQGSTGDIKLNKPVVAMAPTPSADGYWTVASDGGIFAFGDSVFQGSTGDIKLNKPVVGMAATASGKGYWMVASDGGIFAFGDATFEGSTGDIKLNQPIVAMMASASGRGYHLVAADGGVFTFGDASFQGSTGALPASNPIATGVRQSG